MKPKSETSNKETEKLSFSSKILKISELNPRDRYWSFKALLTKVSPVKNARNSKKNRYKRLQFVDATGAIEALVLGLHCDEPNIKELEGKQVYQISGGDLVLSALKNRFWQAENQIPFDLVVNSSTSFKQLLIREAEHMGVSCFLNPDDHIGPGGFSLKYPCLYKLNRLHLKKPFDLINVIGVVYKVGSFVHVQSRENPQKNYQLRRITLIDETEKAIEVTLWDQRAKDFCYPVGSILFFQNVRISDYGGISLTVNKNTGFIEFRKEDDNIENSKNLRDWWNSYLMS